MMQRRYRADGWLGMLVGAKLYINFDGKYAFDDAYQMLLKELQGRGKDASEGMIGKYNLDGFTHWWHQRPISQRVYKI